MRKSLTRVRIINDNAKGRAYPDGREVIADYETSAPIADAISQFDPFQWGGWTANTMDDLRAMLAFAISRELTLSEFADIIRAGRLNEVGYYNRAAEFAHVA